MMLNILYNCISPRQNEDPSVDIPEQSSVFDVNFAQGLKENLIPTQRTIYILDLSSVMKGVT